MRASLLHPAGVLCHELLQLAQKGVTKGSRLLKYLVPHLIIGVLVVVSVVLEDVPPQ